MASSSGVRRTLTWVVRFLKAAVWEWRLAGFEHHVVEKPKLGRLSVPPAWDKRTCF